jgi:hypothetical protein
MLKILALVGGLLNGVFTLFHLWLGWQIYSVAALEPGFKSLMEMLNVGLVFLVLLFALAALLYPEELVSTKIGKLLIGASAVFYLSRAGEEILISMQFSWQIFSLCLAVGLYYLALLLFAIQAGSLEFSRKG